MHYKKIYFLDQSIQKIFYLILKKEALRPCGCGTVVKRYIMISTARDTPKSVSFGAHVFERIWPVLLSSKLNKSFVGCFDPEIYWSRDIFRWYKWIIFGVNSPIFRIQKKHWTWPRVASSGMYDLPCVLQICPGFANEKVVHICCKIAGSSVAVLAEILLRLPRKLFVFIINKYIYRIKVSKKIIN